MFSQNKEVSLWETVPNAVENEAYKETFRVDKKGVVNAVRDVKKPTLKLFLANNSKTDNTAVVICPGGGYSVISHIKEGDKIAEWFNSIGISAFVLKYRLPSDLIMKDKTIGPLQDAQEAMRMVRRNAKEWNINPNKVGVIGFSAGGHLAATLSTQYNEIVYPSDTTSARPDFSMLIYPVISMKDGVTLQGFKLK
ncbi:MAG: alpha/beta hydrolase [Polaribacter sp.]